MTSAASSTSSAFSALEYAAATTRHLLPQRTDIRDMLRHRRRNIVAGLTVSIVALPLALAFGVASGLGAQAGLVTAIIAGTIAAFFGGSNVQVSGPTGAMTAVLLPIVHRYGTRAVLLVGVMAGVILVAMAAARLGRYVKFLPVSLIEGFTLGIAVVIALQQMPNTLGVADAGEERVWRTGWEAVQDFAASNLASVTTWAAPAIAVGVAAAMLLGAKWRPRVPFSLIAVTAATVVTYAAHLAIPTIGNLPTGLPTASAAFFDVSLMQTVLPAALAVAALAALESLLSATVADGMSVGERHDPDRELFGQGLANIAVPFFGGVPATAAIARTAVNARAGATSRLAAIVHAVALLAVMLVAAPLVAHIPLAALAGVLLATTLRMAERASVLALMRSTRADGWILALTFAVTVALDLVTAVGVGLGVAVVLALRTVAKTARVEKVPLEVGDYSEEEHALLREHIVAYRLDGPLFFAAAHQFLIELTNIVDVRVVILRMSRVSTVDATGAKVLEDAIGRLEARGIVVLLSGLDESHRNVLRALGVGAHLRTLGRVFADTPAAIAHARELVAAPH
ncbi:MAG: sodium-independent anion transporter [Actinobacteria bacterium HGW-Actinobacteria-4]|nr:MAG: sodium-independent anion transporter [Actinobacteria bacterium HGW-Actinobacteria-4]